MGEFIWLKQGLENEFRCLPEANFEIKLENIGVRTKSAIAKKLK